MGDSGHFQILPDNSNRGPSSREKFFTYVRERNRWLLDNGGERVILLKRKFDGVRCTNFDSVRKTNMQHDDLICFGGGFVGGFFAPIEITVSLLATQPEQLTIEENGRKRTSTTSSWCLWEPLLTPGDFLIRRNNQRLLITDVKLCRWKHFVTHQKFTTSEVERNHVIYQFPLGL